MSPPFVHASAVVDEGALLADDVQVWHFSHVSAGAVIGRGSKLGQNVYVAGTVRVGAGVKVQNNVSLYDGVTLEDDVFCGPSCVFTNVRNPRAAVDRRSEFLPTRVGRGATIGANATIVCGTVIGEYAFVAAGAVVTAAYVPPFARMVGVPARRTGWVGRAGESLVEGECPGEFTCPRTGERYREATGGLSLAFVGESSLPDAAVAEPIPLVDLAAEAAAMRGEVEAAVTRVLRSKRFVLGDEGKAFERAMSEATGLPHAVALSSGTDALLVALAASGIGPGDEVVTTPFTFVATASAIVRLGAVPVFADVDTDASNLDPGAVRRVLGPRTKAILAVHLFGRMADVRALRTIAADHQLTLLEDAAQAVFASRDGAVPGALSSGCTLSFYPTKNLGGVGDGGMFLSTDSTLAARVRLLRNHGQGTKYDSVALGGNFRMDEIQAAAISAKLPYVAAWTRARKDAARAYDRAFVGAGLAEKGLSWPGADVHEGHVFHHFVVRTKERDALREHLRAEGIETGVYYPVPLHLQKAFEAHAPPEGSLPNAERASRESLALPVHPHLGEGRIARVARAVVTYFDGR
ncbi:MAG: DegT/DnrJ/EryC1/StrS family aminotransferase [Polyangiaceae bacterium]